MRAILEGARSPRCARRPFNPCRPHDADDDEQGDPDEITNTSSRTARDRGRCRRLGGRLLNRGPASGAHPEGTRIVAATVYPDSARVERERNVPGGTRHITIACVPAAVDVSTLQVDGDADARMGDARAADLPSSRVEECAPPVSARPAQGARAAAGVAGVAARRQRPRVHVPAPVGRGPARGHARTRERAHAREPSRGRDAPGRDRGRAAQERARPAHRPGARQARAARRSRWRRPAWPTTSQPARARPAGAPCASTCGRPRRRRCGCTTTWPARTGVRPTAPSLDTARATLRIDRQAEIVQASGEDWSDVRVQPVHAPAAAPGRGGQPAPWWLDLVQAVARVAGYSAARPRAGAPVAGEVDRQTNVPRRPRPTWPRRAGGAAAVGRAGRPRATPSPSSPSPSR